MLANRQKKIKKLVFKSFHIFAASFFNGMSITEIIIIAIGLSMDAFSVSICKGLNSRIFSTKTAISCGLWFGGFQALMPLIGYVLGMQFESYIRDYDHWVAFGLLALIGGNMIREALSSDDEEHDEKNGFVTMLILAIATSIDALAVGISLACLKANIWMSVAIIGVTTFVFSVVGVRIGNVFGTRYKNKAEFCGGVILILIGIKILVEHCCNLA